MSKEEESNTKCPGCPARGDQQHKFSCSVAGYRISGYNQAVWTTIYLLSKKKKEEEIRETGE